MGCGLVPVRGGWIGEARRWHGGHLGCVARAMRRRMETPWVLLFGGSFSPMVVCGPWVVRTCVVVLVSVKMRVKVSVKVSEGECKGEWR